MDLKQIKQIIDLMKRSELTEFAVEEEGFKLKIRRGATGLPVLSAPRGGSNNPFGDGLDTNPPMALPSAPAVGSNPPTTASGGDEIGVTFVKSPMVGTFYKSASPESKAYVEPGSKVVETTVVCIIEAMKIMNEIQAELKGTIVEQLVENGSPVEYGQKLFKVKQL